MNTHVGQPSHSNSNEQDRCAKCAQIGNTREMFTCIECKEAWHPSCATDYPPKDENDPRYRAYFCIPCARMASRRQWAPKRKYKTFQSDSE